MSRKRTIKNRIWGKQRIVATIWLLLLTVGHGTLAASNNPVDDIRAIDTLRGQLGEAILSGSPEAIGKLVSEDYVHMQPNVEGPNLYGKQYYLDYLPALNRVTKLRFKLAKDVELFGNWAVESGEMVTDVLIAGETVEHATRYMKVLHRESTGWKYARDITTTYLTANNSTHKAPPAPGFITYAGKADWEPMASPDSVADLSAQDEACRNKMIRKMDPVNAALECIWPHDMDAVAQTGKGVVSFKHFMAYRHSQAAAPYDELEKYFKEMIVDGDFGFAWGHSVATAAYSSTGARRAGFGTSFYIFRKDDSGRWLVWGTFNTKTARWEPNGP